MKDSSISTQDIGSRNLYFPHHIHMNASSLTYTCLHRTTLETATQRLAQLSISSSYGQPAQKNRTIARNRNRTFIRYSISILTLTTTININHHLITRSQYIISRCSNIHRWFKTQQFIIEDITTEYLLASSVSLSLLDSRFHLSITNHLSISNLRLIRQISITTHLTSRQILATRFTILLTQSITILIHSHISSTRQAPLRNIRRIRLSKSTNLVNSNSLLNQLSRNLSLRFTRSSSRLDIFSHLCITHLRRSRKSKAKNRH